MSLSASCDMRTRAYRPVGHRQAAAWRSAKRASSAGGGGRLPTRERPAAAASGGDGCVLEVLMRRAVVAARERPLTGLALACRRWHRTTPPSRPVDLLLDEYGRGADWPRHRPGDLRLRGDQMASGCPRSPVEAGEVVQSSASRSIVRSHSKARPWYSIWSDLSAYGSIRFLMERWMLASIDTPGTGAGRRDRPSKPRRLPDPSSWAKNGEDRLARPSVAPFAPVTKSWLSSSVPATETQGATRRTVAVRTTLRAGSSALVASASEL